MEADHVLKNRIYNLANDRYRDQRAKVYEKVRNMLSQLGVPTTRISIGELLNKLKQAAGESNLSDVQNVSVQQFFFTQATDEILGGGGKSEKVLLSYLQSVFSLSRHSKTSGDAPR